jgi:mersacidin/lichenicidin family type 2 lantibiotic
MTNESIVRAWKDEGYREGLSAEQRAVLPANPAGALDLSEAEMAAVNGGLPPTRWYTGCGSWWIFCE